MKEKNRSIKKVMGRLMATLAVVALFISACSPQTPVAEQPLPNQPEATTEPEPEPETPAEVPEISQPIARWNSVSEKGTWVLIGYGDAGNPTVVEPGTYVTINFSPVDNQVGGSGGCNSYSTTYTADDNYNLTINSPIASTMMACETGLEQEVVFLTALESVTGYLVTEKGQLLLKYGSNAGNEQQLEFIPAASLVDTLWILRAYGDPNNLAYSEVGVVTTAVFAADGNVSGFTGCNNYSAGYTQEENQITVSQALANMMACEKGMEQEAAFLKLLESAQSYRLGINALEISNTDGTQVMRFAAWGLPLENVRWILTSINEEILPEEVSVNLVFTPGGSPSAQAGENSVTGSAGCNNFFGNYTLTGDTLAAGPFGSTQMMCSDEAMQVEQAFLSNLENVQSYQISNNQLTINTVNGTLLFYADRMPLEGPQWVLTGIGEINSPQLPEEGADLTVVFGRQFGMPSGVLSGATKCGDFAIAYYAGFDEMKVNLPQTSLDTCSDPQAETFNGYFQNLNAARDYRILGNELHIFYNSSVLIFTGSYPIANHTPLLPLDGTQWLLTFIDMVPLVPDSEVTLLFDVNPDGKTGTVSGSGGCNNYSAEIVDVFTLGPVSTSSAICDSPEGVMEQETTYLGILQKASGIWIEGDTLKITTDLETLHFSRNGSAAVQPLPIQALINAPTESQVNEPISFDGAGSSSSAEITSYQWDFGDGTTGAGAAVEHIYISAGVYDVILIINDADGNSATASMQITLNANLVGPTWILEGTEISLIFTGNTLSGNAGCNDYSAGYISTMAAGNSNSISIDTITNTGSACEEDIMNKEQAYLTQLQSANSFIINGNILTLSSTEGMLTFYAAEVSN